MALTRCNGSFVDVATGGAMSCSEDVCKHHEGLRNFPSLEKKYRSLESL